MVRKAPARPAVERLMRDALETAGWSQAELARQSGYGRGTTDEIVRGQTARMDPEVVTSLCRLLGIRLEVFLKAGEMLRLTLADVDLDRRELRIMGKGRRERVVPFDAATKVALLEYLIRERGREPGPLFLSRDGAPMTANALKIMLRRLEQRAGCAHVTPHAFRRGFARHTRRAGLDLGEVAALMGHATLEMTRRYSQAGEAEAARDAWAGTYPGQPLPPNPCPQPACVRPSHRHL